MSFHTRLLGALAKLGNRKAVWALAEKLSDSDTVVRKAATEALRSSNDEEAARLLDRFGKFKLQLAEMNMPRDCQDRAAPLAWRLAARDEEQFKTNLQIIKDALAQLRDSLETRDEYREARSSDAYEDLLNTGLEYVMRQRFLVEDASRFIELFVSNIVVREHELLEWEYHDYDTAGDLDHVGWGQYHAGYAYSLDMNSTLAKTVAKFRTMC